MEEADVKKFLNREKAEEIVTNVRICAKIKIIIANFRKTSG